MPKFVVWNGTSDEARELTEALAHNCQCEYGAMNIRLKTCAAHEAFTTDQRWCDWLVFLKRNPPNEGWNGENEAGS